MELTRSLFKFHCLRGIARARRQFRPWRDQIEVNLIKKCAGDALMESECRPRSLQNGRRAPLMLILIPHDLIATM
jgi:hypothetical protein